MPHSTDTTAFCVRRSNDRFPFTATGFKVLVLPVFKGAAYVYENFVRQMLLNPNARATNSVERFVHQYGPDALDRAMKRITMGWGSFLKAVLYNIDIFAGPVVTLLYPLYSSIRVIESPSRLDDQQWLTYWVLYSFMTLFELSFSWVLEWLPFWPYVKLIATCWLVLPVFKGAAYVYENFVRQMLLNPNARATNSVECFVHQYGPDALDRAMKRAEKEAKINRNGGYDDYEY